MIKIILGKTFQIIFLQNVNKNVYKKKLLKKNKHRITNFANQIFAYECCYFVTNSFRFIRYFPLWDETDE